MATHEQLNTVKLADEGNPLRVVAHPEEETDGHRDDAPFQSWINLFQLVIVAQEDLAVDSCSEAEDLCPCHNKYFVAMHVHWPARRMQQSKDIGKYHRDHDSENDGALFGPIIKKRKSNTDE